MNNKSHVRVFHAVPNAPAVDVYLNNDLIVEGLRYSRFTPYLPVKPGEYTVYVYASGTSDTPLIEEDVVIPDDVIYTVAAVGLPSDPQLLPIEDPKIDLEKGKLGLRFGHLSPDAPNVDIVLPDGTILFENVGFKEVTDYLQVDPGTYSVNVVPTGTQTVVLQIPNIQLKPDRFYSVYAIGLTNMQPMLQVVIPLDGNSYINNSNK